MKTLIHPPLLQVAAPLCTNEDLPSFENILTKTTSLEEHLIWQLSMIDLTEQEKKLGELIVGNLTDDGYLNSNLEDLATEAEMELEDAEEVLKMIHHFDPLGVASRNLQECLLIQAEFLQPRQPLVEMIIQNHLSQLEKKNYNTIAKNLGVTRSSKQPSSFLILNQSLEDLFTLPIHNTSHLIFMFIK